MTIELLNCDCMDYLSGLPDKAFDLAVVDPPYGNNLNGGRNEKCGWNPLMNWDKCVNQWNTKTPNQRYFDEIARVCKNQVVFGGNYFANMLPNSQGWIVWDKGQRNFTLADGEMAWTSFDKALRIYQLSRSSANRVHRIHPTQKPVALYRWIFQNYAKPGQRILDTHLGSGSSAIAAHYEGLDFVGCELDKEYYDAAARRVKEQTRQMDLFDVPAIKKEAVRQQCKLL